ncbi:MAG: apolipoprotein N-acyltransferase [Gammaproteobacteria bacterium]|nr:apolipoprotein N-acyltransferase [Gammaproteobacteria bacterium]
MNRSALQGWPGDLAALGVGAVSVLAFAPFDVWPLAIVCPALLFALWCGCSARRAAWRGFLYGAGEFLAGIYWIVVAISGIGSGPWWLGILLYVLLALCCAVFPGVLGYLARRAAPGPGLVWLLLLPAGWTLGEWVRSFALTGFPWLALGYSQATLPFGGYAPVLGLYGASLACVLAAVLLLWLLSLQRRWVARGGALAGLIAVFALGAGLGQIAWTQPSGPPFEISLVQGNIEQATKWNPGQFRSSIEKYVQLSRPHLASDVIVWPENAISGWYMNALPFLTDFVQNARDHGTALAFGSPLYNQQTGEAFATVVSLVPKPGAYLKRHLVPFGEYFPVPDWIKSWLAAHMLPYSSFTPGPWEQPPLAIGKWQAAVALCYEIAFGRLLITQLPEADFILNPSDDGWFGRTIAMDQQFQMAQLAARETGRYVAAATDSGITAIIDARGEVLARLPAHEVGVLTGRVVPYGGMTPYVRWGNWFVVSLCTGLFILAFAQAFRRRRARRRSPPPG